MLLGRRGKGRKRSVSRATCSGVIPVRLHSKTGTRVQSGRLSDACSEVDAKSRFRFFHSTWVVSLMPSLISPFSSAS
ncbi:hypothetical protein J2X83_003474 [Brevibacillus nitrificans]|nr:hypothetical protein [Brevibacillus nitrificans]